MSTPRRSPLQRFLSWYLPPEAQADPVLNMRALVVLFVTLPGTVIGLIYTLTLTATHPDAYAKLPTHLCLLALLGLCGGLVFWQKTVRMSLHFTAIMLTVLVLWTVYYHGGLTGSAGVWLATTPVLAAFISGRTGLLLSSGLVVAALVWISALHAAGTLPPPDFEQTPILYLTSISWALLSLVGLTYFTDGRLSRTMERLQTQVDMRRNVEQSLRHAQERLQLAKNAAEVGSAAKGAFLAQVSHEIRNPLTTIMGTIDLLELPNTDAARISQIALLRRSSEALLDLVDDVLDFSKIEAGHLDMNPMSISPRDLLESVEKMYRPLAVEQGVDLLLELDPELPDRSVLDPIRVQQVLSNLVSNAIKFTTVGAVTLELWNAQMDDGQPALIFGVEDTGIGIPEDAQKRIFDPYVQAELTTTNEYGGTGLGLPISSRLVSLMGGEFGFETTVGEGSRFWFIVPAQQDISSSSLVETTEKAAYLAQILVVEDDDLNREVVTELLESLGHRVTSAPNGQAAVSAYLADPPDLVLMDIRMPVMDGMEAARQIRSHEQERGMERIPILAMTADVEVERVASYSGVGMDDLLAKPVNRAKLSAAVQGWALRRTGES